MGNQTCCNTWDAPDIVELILQVPSITPPAKFHSKQEGVKDQQNTLQHYVFNWLNWSPEPETPIYTALHKNFPGALPGLALHYRTKSILEAEKYGFTGDNTLFGLSICPDEINHRMGELPDLMKNHWGEVFPLGGISGAPFVGTTGFGAFSNHVPDDGNIIILFGPHVGITEQGEIGKYCREGQSHSSSACGAVIGAYNACASVNGKADDLEHSLGIDMQMAWIKTQLKPHIDHIKGQPEVMTALAFQAYEMVKAKLEKIVNTKFGNGKLVLIGGIQINTPEPFQDHFLPLMFEVRQQGQPPVDLLSSFSCSHTQQEMNVTPSAKLFLNARKSWTKCLSDSPKSGFTADPQITPEADALNVTNDRPRRQLTVESPFLRQQTPSVFKDWQEVKEAEVDYSAQLAQDKKASGQHAVFNWLSLSPEPGTNCFRTLHRQFPGALPGAGVYARVQAILTADFDFTPENALYGSSICPDEINNSKGGLNCLMQDYWGELFPLGGIGGAPFVGKTGFKAFSNHVPDGGNVIILFGPHVAISDLGEVGKYLREGQMETSTACGAVIGAYNAIRNLKDDEAIEFDEADMQMAWIKTHILPHADRISKHRNPMAALSYQAFESVKATINKVVNTDFGNGRLVLIGGIQINLPPPANDHFLPMVFEVRQAGMPTENLMEAFQCPITQDELRTHHEHYHFQRPCSA